MKASVRDLCHEFLGSKKGWRTAKCCVTEVLEGFRPKQFTKGVEEGWVSSIVPTAKEYSDLLG